MIFKITIRGAEWIIYLERRKLIRADRPDVERELNQDQMDWFREYVRRMYGTKAVEGSYESWVIF